MIGGWIAARRDDFRTLTESWHTLRGRWSVARHNAAELVMHRRVLVETPCVMAGETQVALRTRLRLQGDTQTDILGPWLRAARRAEVEQIMATHARAMQTAMDGFAAALSFERLAMRVVALVASAASLLAMLLTFVAAPPRLWLHIVLLHWWLWIGFAIALLAAILRFAMGWWLRRRFRLGLGMLRVPA